MIIIITFSYVIVNFQTTLLPFQNFGLTLLPILPAGRESRLRSSLCFLILSSEWPDDFLIFKKNNEMSYLNNKLDNYIVSLSGIER